MSARDFILDTDILSLLMRKNAAVLAKASAYVSDHSQFTISIITRYEILRGLKAKDAGKQAERFEDFCATSRVLSIDDTVIIQAADIYADLYKRGELIADADILIAASALANGCGIVTNNEAHFRRIAGLKVENWLKRANYKRHFRSVGRRGIRCAIVELGQAAWSPPSLAICACGTMSMAISADGKDNVGRARSTLTLALILDAAGFAAPVTAIMSASRSKGQRAKGETPRGIKP